MEISTIGRPRNVGWVRAAALLYGDWGTSKAYVIGLAFVAAGFVQELRAAPVESPHQSLGWKERERRCAAEQAVAADAVAAGKLE